MRVRCGIGYVVGAIAIGVCVVAAWASHDDRARAQWEVRSFAAMSLKNEQRGNEPAWYRCYIRVPDNMTALDTAYLWADSVTLSFAGMPEKFVVYLNGNKVAEGGKLPAEPRRRFKVAKGALEPGVFNVLTVRVESGGAMTKPPILAGYFDELVLDQGWEVFAQPGSEKVDPAKFVSVKKSPSEEATYTEKGFRQSSTPLSANMETMPGRRLPPGDSLKTMKPADGLVVELMLSEPIVAQPTHLSFDERGRMWVAQYRQYPYPAGLKMISRDKYYRSRFDKVPPAPPKHDRGRDVVSVHEDTDGDGKFDKDKVVLDGLNMANAVLRGHGGIWVMHTPYLMFYPDADGDDVPDRDPEVRLAGFGLEDTHSTANGLAWGMDGWLYGVQGSTTTSRIMRPGVDSAGSPGTFYEGCMVWRYHPETKVYEIFCEGGGNNFGLALDSEGRLFGGHNGGQTRAWHFVQEGIYLKQDIESGKYGPPRNVYAFGDLPMVKSANVIPRFTHNLIVFGGTALPKKFIGQTIGVDPLHRNLVTANLKRRGSTFESADDGNPLSSDDIAFRPVYITDGPDGAVYVADFYEEFIAHGQNYQGQIDPTTGRVYRVRAKDIKLKADVNLAGKSTAQLVETLSHPNQWHRQTAVRLLGERRDAGAVPLLRALLAKPEVHPALEALWALHQMGMLHEATPLAALSHPAAPVRAWAVRLIGDAKKLPDDFARSVEKLISSEADPEVRAQIASTARRLPATQALPLVAGLYRRDVDADDPYVPLLCWWTIESHIDADLPAVMAMLNDPSVMNAAIVKQQLLNRLMRRLATHGTRAELLACATLLERAPGDEQRTSLMRGFEHAFKGRALPSLPDELVKALAKSGQASPVLRVRLGEADAIESAIKAISERQAKTEDLVATVTVLGEVNVPRAVPALLAIVRDDKRPELRKAALTSMLRYDDAAIGEKVTAAYASLPPDVRPAAQNLLASRPAWVADLLKLVETGTIKPADVPPDIVIRLKAHEDADVAASAEKLFPGAAPSARAAKLAEVQRVRRVIEASPGDPYKGEEIFMQRCATCHKLFFKGGDIGPNLSTYQRDDLGTMLTSILEPSAEVREGYATYVVRTKDRRTLSGFLTENDGAVVTVRGSDGQDVRVPRADVKDLKPMGSSLMPDGLLEGLNDQQLRDFFAYLRISQPITR